MPSGWMTNSPSGLRQSEASFAKNLLVATPAEAVRFSSWRICSRIVRATSVAAGRPVFVGGIRVVHAERLSELTLRASAPWRNLRFVLNQNSPGQFYLTLRSQAVG
jgi:hypothetical protein